MPRQLVLLAMASFVIAACTNSASSGGGTAAGTDTKSTADSAPSGDSSTAVDTAGAADAAKGGDTTAPTGSVAIEALPAAMIKAICASLAKCPGGLMAFADAKDCETMMADKTDAGDLSPMMEAVKAGKVKYDGAKAVECLKALAATCGAFKMAKLPTGCAGVFSGTLEDGKACTEAAFCKSNRCDKSADPDCGKCAPILKLGDACNESGDCLGDLVCVQGKCSSPTPGKAGAPCDGSDQCEPALFCQQDGDKGACAPRLDAGAECNSGSDCKDGLVCKKGADKSTCAPPAKENEVCATVGLFGDTGDCGPGLTCAMTGDLSNPATIKLLCLPLAKLGGACVAGNQCTGLDVGCIGGKCAILPAKGAACTPKTKESLTLSCLMPWVCDPAGKVCVDRPATGKPCIENKCAKTAKCANGQCVDLGKAGEECISDDECQPSLGCDKGKCAAKAVCQ